jgi:hypothetical protein
MPYSQADHDAAATQGGIGLLVAAVLILSIILILAVVS